MAAPDIITNVWNWNNPKYSKPEPANSVLNPFRPSPIVKKHLSYDRVSGGKSSFKGRPVKFLNTTNSHKQFMDIKRNKKWNLHVERSRFYSNIDDGESKQKSMVSKITKDNPEFILSRVNDKEAKDNIENPNSIAKNIMVDSGTGNFDYDPPNANQVGIVKDSNAAYAKRRDMYFIPDQQGITRPPPFTSGQKDAQSLADLLARISKQGRLKKTL